MDITQKILSRHTPIEKIKDGLGLYSTNQVKEMLAEALRNKPVAKRGPLDDTVCVFSRFAKRRKVNWRF